MEKNTNKKAGKILFRIIGIILIVLIIICLNKPSMLVFLNDSQKEAVTLFNETYFGKYMPIQTEDGGFDFIKVIALAFMILACVALSWLLKTVIGLIKFKNRHSETIKSLLSNIIKYAILIFAIVFGLNMLGADILTVIAGLGILALVIGFGAQSLIEDVFAGLFIIFEGRFYVGDIITIDNFRGTVVSIGVVSTQIRDTGGNIRIINNSDIRTLTNLSNVTSLAISIVSISYNANLVKAEKVIGDLCINLPEMYPNYFKVPPKYLGVEDLSESSVDLKVVADVDENNIYQARRILNRELKLALDKNDIEIPFPQVVVWQGKENKETEQESEQ